MSLNNTRIYLEKLRDQIYQEIEQIYDYRKYHTSEELVSFIKEENVILLRLRQKVYDTGMKAAIEGMKADGISYPELLWAKKIGQKVERPEFKSIYQDVPKAEDTLRNMINENTDKSDLYKSGDDKKTTIAGAAITGGGAVMTAVTLTTSPVSSLLLVLGIVITVSGVIVLTGNSLKKRKTGTSDTQRHDEQEKIMQILKIRQTENKKVVNEWCAGVYKLVKRVVEEETEKG